jgi:choline monooxygenase
VSSAIVCPYHAWTFEREGNLRRARFSEDRPGFDKADFGLRPIRLEVFCDCVFVNLDEGAESLASLAGEMEEDLRRRVPYLGDLEMPSKQIDLLGTAHQNAGWKVVVDNYVECYHCANAHPALADLMVMGSYRHEVHEHWARQLSPQVRSDNSAYRVEEGDDVQVAAYWYLWPTTSIWLVPGAANLFVLAMMPGDHETTVFSGHRYAADDAPDPARTAYLNETLGPEDQGLCESVQRGLRSRSYDQGRLMVDPARSGTAEHGVHQFHRLVTRALDDGTDR